MFSSNLVSYHIIMQEPEPIDWEYYRKGIGSRLVDMYKEAYESMYLPDCLFEFSVHFICMNPLFHILIAPNP